MSDRLLRRDERLLVGQYYKAWMPSPRVPQGQGFTEYMSARDLEVITADPLGANACIVTVRAHAEKTYTQASSNMVGGLADATRWGLNVDQVVWYATDAPPGFLERAAAAATEPIRQGAQAVQRGASVVAGEGRSTLDAIRDVASSYASFLKWAPVVLVVGGVVYLVATARSSR